MGQFEFNFPEPWPAASAADMADVMFDVPEYATKVVSEPLPTCHERVTSADATSSDEA